jgi:ankyrin repeat protein
MVACQGGFFDIVFYLIEHGARVEARDRFKRTPLIHACMYGHAHIVSHLLRLGANINVFDSSMNTALHYAIAYGWYFCVRLLVEAGANTNSTNCCQTTCLGIAFSKGHYGICDYLLTEHQADINIKTDEGLTLVMITVNLEISSSAVHQLEYVAVKHKADCTSIDINGRNAFHYLSLNQTSQSLNCLNEKEQNNLKKSYFRMSQI